jgi:hypothetical protein
VDYNHYFKNEQSKQESVAAAIQTSIKRWNLLFHSQNLSIQHRLPALKKLPLLTTLEPCNYFLKQNRGSIAYNYASNPFLYGLA